MDAATLEVQTLDGRLLASLSGPASLQTLGGNQTWMNEPIQRQSEDCLFLNVWTPDVGARLPVLFWLHGGGIEAAWSAIYTDRVFMAPLLHFAGRQARRAARLCV